MNAQQNFFTLTLHDVRYDLRHDTDGYSWHYCGSKGDPRLCGFASKKKAVAILTAFLGACRGRP